MINNKFDILCIIVTYNPDNISVLNDIIEIVSKDSDVILIDNSDEVDIINDISKNIINLQNLVQVNENKGIAFAQNIGLKKAIELNYKYVLLLDDDSIPQQNFIYNIIKNYKELLNQPDLIIGSLSARPLVINNNKVIDLSNTKIDQRNKFTVYNLMNSSGTLIPTDVLKNVGLMDEDLFIDLVDFDWCFRATSKNYKHFLCRDIYFKHSLGESTKSFFGYKISKGSPLRNYYGFRNLILLLKRNHVPIFWKILSIIKLPIKVIYQFLFFDNKLIRLKYIYEGLKSGIFDEVGKYKY